MLLEVNDTGVKAKTCITLQRPGNIQNCLVITFKILISTDLIKRNEFKVTYFNYFYVVLQTLDKDGSAHGSQ
jgi:hypothetical protein